MAHLDDADLALLAVGGTVSAEASAHLASCDVCTTALAHWRRTVAAPEADDVPPARTWTAIADDLGLEDRSQPQPVAASAPAASPPATPVRRSTPAGRRWVLAAVAVLIAAAGVAAGLWIARPAANTVTVVAEARLAPFPGWSEQGTATLERDRAGNQTLAVTLPGSAPGDELREVWLMRSDLSGLISLGLLSGDEGTFDIPSGIDLREFTVVDVSAEPADGNPAHSGDSIVRGTLDPR